MITSQPLNDILELAPYEKALRSLGYETLEEFTYVAHAASPELAKYLQVESVDNLLAPLPMAVAAIPAHAHQTMRQASYPLGAAISAVPRLQTAPSFVAADDLPPQINHIADLTAIRQQGTRGTCVAHAALALYEHHCQKQGTPMDFSEQFLYWNCKRSDNIPQESGTYLGIALPLLQDEGCCLETTWPYQSQPIAGNESQNPPPGGAQLEALQFRINGYNQLAPTSVIDIKNELSEGRCVAFSIPVFNSWHLNEYVILTGDIGNPLPGETRRGGHAMCLVGYVDMPNKPALGGGRFLLRNSWGDQWGIESSYGVGYGTIPYSYIARSCAEAYSIK